MHLLLGFLAIAAIVVVIIAVAVIAIRSMSRDRRHGTSGSLSSAMLNVQSLLEPEKRHAVESLQADDEKSDEDFSGDPPDATIARP